MEKNINFIVKEDENNLRVDVLINKREELISRTRIKNLILKEKLKLNNEIIKSPSKKVLIGDKINLQIPQPETTSLKPYKFKLKIILEYQVTYEGRNILVNNILEEFTYNNMGDKFELLKIEENIIKTIAKKIANEISITVLSNNQ